MSDEPNNIDAQLARDDIRAALAAQTQQVTSIVMAEQITRSEQLARLTEQQRKHNEALATTLERLAFGLRGDWNTFRADLRSEMDARFKARDEQVDTLVAHLEERIIRPFSELPERVETLEYGYANLADRLDVALDPNTPGATIEMVKLQHRVDLLTRLLWFILAALVALALFMAWHQYFVWERLR